MILVLILGITFVVGRPKPKIAASTVSTIKLTRVVHYLPKKDEEIMYWTSNMA